MVGCDLLLGDVRSLEQKRSVVHPIVAERRRRFELSVAEIGPVCLLRRASIERAITNHPEV